MWDFSRLVPYVYRFCKCASVPLRMNTPQWNRFHVVPCAHVESRHGLGKLYLQARRIDRG